MANRSPNATGCWFDRYRCPSGRTAGLWIADRRERAGWHTQRSSAGNSSRQVSVRCAQRILHAGPPIPHDGQYVCSNCERPKYIRTVLSLPPFSDHPTLDPCAPAIYLAAAISARDGPSVLQASSRLEQAAVDKAAWARPLRVRGREWAVRSVGDRHEFRVGAFCRLPRAGCPSRPRNRGLCVVRGYAVLSVAKRCGPPGAVLKDALII